MGCGTSKSDLAKGVISAPEGQEPLPRNGTNSSGKKNNKVTPAAQQSDQKKDKKGEKSDDKVDNGHQQVVQQVVPNPNPNPNVQNDPLTYMNGGQGARLSLNSLDPHHLPPLKPPRVVANLKVGFADQQQDSAEEVNHNLKNEPIAFEVPAAEGGSSLIKRHPPRRLRRMEEVPPEVLSLTVESLEEKIQEANNRRTKVLKERVASAKIRQKSARHVRQQFNPAEFEGDVEMTEEPPSLAPEAEEIPSEIDKF